MSLNGTNYNADANYYVQSGNRQPGGGTAFTGRTYEAADREYFTINKPLLFFSPYKLTNDKFTSNNVTDSFAFDAGVIEVNQAAEAVADPQNNAALKQLKEDIKKTNSDGQKQILQNMVDLFRFMEETRRDHMERSGTFYSSMVFHLIHVIKQVSGVWRPNYGCFIPLIIGRYLTGVGDDEAGAFKKLITLTEGNGGFEANYRHSYAWPVCYIIKMKKEKKFTNEAERRAIEAEVIRYIVFLIKMENFIYSWMSGRASDFSLSEAAKVIGAIRSHLLWHVQILAKNGVYMPKDIQEEIYRQYINRPKGDSPLN